MQDFNITITKQQIGAETVNSVDARTLHKALGFNTKNFNEWIHNNLINSRFEPNHSFVELCHSSSKPVSYILTLDTAKHLAMMAKTEKGYEIREYFIQAEKELRLSEQIPSMAIIQELQRQIDELKAIREPMYTMRDYLKSTGMYGISRDTMKSNGWAMTKYCHLNNIKFNTIYYGQNNRVNEYPLSALQAFHTIDD